MRCNYLNSRSFREHCLINISLLSRYLSFAIIATIANLVTQRAVLHLVKFNTSLFLAMVAGTTVGLVTKYILDKRWIFYDSDNSLNGKSLKFVRYTFFGIFTTSIFWFTELLFWFAWQSQLMREIGAILGLSIGYIIKYQLDRKYVFSASFSEKSS